MITALRSRVGRQLAWFVTIGVASTLAYVALYTLLRGWTGPIVANAGALLLTAVGNTAANRRVTFGVRGRDGLIGDHAVGIVALTAALGITTAAIGVMNAFAPNAGRLLEIAVLLLANAAATILRFVMLRSWLTRSLTVERNAR